MGPLKGRSKYAATTALALCAAGCFARDKNTFSNNVFRWSVTEASTDRALGSGCGFFADRHAGLIAFQAPARTDVIETLAWDRVTKSTDGELSFDAVFWCGEQPDVETTRLPHLLTGEQCVGAADADPVARIDAVELVDPVVPGLAPGLRLRMQVIRPGPLRLTYVSPCDPPRHTSDARAPPVWTELTILP